VAGLVMVLVIAKEGVDGPRGEWRVATIARFPVPVRVSVSESLKSCFPMRESRAPVTVPHRYQHGLKVRHRSIELIRNRALNTSGRIHLRLIEPTLRHLFKAGLNYSGLSLPLFVILWTFSPQPQDDGFQ
jgi:hypothetical protein